MSQPGTKTEEKTERKCSHNAMKSVSRMMSTREREAAPSEANKACGRLENDHILDPQNLFKGNTQMLRA